MARQKLFIRENEDTLDDRIRRYARKRGLEPEAAKLALLRVGLFVAAVPFGSTLYRRGPNEPGGSILEGWTTDAPIVQSNYPERFGQYNEPSEQVDDPGF